MKKETYKIPTNEEFDDYCTKKLHILDKEYINALWCSLSKANWRKRNGDIPVDWQTLASAHHGILLQKFGREPRRMSDIVQKHEKIIINEVEEVFSDNGLHYVCYTDGSCDFRSANRVGGSAYIVLKDGEVVKIRNHGQLNTTQNRMELLAIISAVNSCPKGAYVDVYTDSQYCIRVLSKSYKPKANPDLYELYKKCAAHVAGVRFHWVKGHNGNTYNEMADNLAYSAYCDVCDRYGIEKSRRN
jgi:ribonuclease HI